MMKRIETENDRNNARCGVKVCSPSSKCWGCPIADEIEKENALTDEAEFQNFIAEEFPQDFD